MNASAHRPPWTVAVGVLIGAAGLALFAVALAGDGPGLWWSVGALCVAAALELAAGISLQRHNGPAISHIVTGALATAFIGFMAVAVIIDGRAAAVGPVALAVGVYYLVVATVQVLDVAIDRPRAAIPELLDALVTFAVGLVIASRWRDISTSLLATLIGVELAFRGLAVLGAARMVWRHPELSPYHGRHDTLDSLADAVGAANPPERLNA